MAPTDPTRGPASAPMAAAPPSITLLTLPRLPLRAPLAQAQAKAQAPAPPLQANHPGPSAAPLGPQIALHQHRAPDPRAAAPASSFAPVPGPLHAVPVSPPNAPAPQPLLRIRSQPQVGPELAQAQYSQHQAHQHQHQPRPEPYQQQHQHLAGQFHQQPHHRQHQQAHEQAHPQQAQHQYQHQHQQQPAAQAPHQQHQPYAPPHLRLPQLLAQPAPHSQREARPALESYSRGTPTISPRSALHSQAPESTQGSSYPFSADAATEKSHSHSHSHSLSHSLAPSSHQSHQPQHFQSKQGQLSLNLALDHSPPPPSPLEPLNRPLEPSGSRVQSSQSLLSLLQSAGQAQTQPQERQKAHDQPLPTYSQELLRYPPQSAQQAQTQAPRLLQAPLRLMMPQAQMVGRGEGADARYDDEDSFIVPLQPLSTQHASHKPKPKRLVQVPHLADDEADDEEARDRENSPDDPWDPASPHAAGSAGTGGATSSGGGSKKGLHRGQPRKPPAVRLEPGTRIRILWPRDGRWHKAQVKKFDPKKALHTVFTDHGDSRRVDLRVNQWEPLSEDADAPFLVSGLGVPRRSASFHESDDEDVDEDEYEREVRVEKAAKRARRMASEDCEAEEQRWRKESREAAPLPFLSPAFEQQPFVQDFNSKPPKQGTSSLQTPQLQGSKQSQSRSGSAGASTPLLRLPHGFFAGAKGQAQVGASEGKTMQRSGSNLKDQQWLKLGLTVGVDCGEEHNVDVGPISVVTPSLVSPEPMALMTAGDGEELTPPTSMAVVGERRMENSSSHIVGCTSAESEYEEGSIVTSKPRTRSVKTRNLLALSLGAGVTEEDEEGAGVVTPCVSGMPRGRRQDKAVGLGHLASHRSGTTSPDEPMVFPGSEEEWSLVLAVARRLQKDRSVRSGDVSRAESRERVSEDEGDDGRIVSEAALLGVLDRMHKDKVRGGEVIQSASVLGKRSTRSTRSQTPQPVGSTGYGDGAVNKVEAGRSGAAAPATWVLGTAFQKDFLSLGPRQSKCPV